MKFDRIELHIGTPTEFLLGVAKTNKDSISEFAIGLLFFTIVFVFVKLKV